MSIEQKLCWVKIFQLQSMLNEIRCTDQRFAFKNSPISCLALIINLSSWKIGNWQKNQLWRVIYHFFPAIDTIQWLSGWDWLQRVRRHGFVSWRITRNSAGGAAIPHTELRGAPQLLCKRSRHDSGQSQMSLILLEASKESEIMGGYTFSFCMKFLDLFPWSAWWGWQQQKRLIKHYAPGVTNKGTALPWMQALAPGELYDLVLTSFVKTSKALDWLMSLMTNHSMVW